MKKTLIYIFAFIVLCFGSDFLIDYSLGQQFENQSPYRVAFASTGANLLESRMDCWAKIETSPNFNELDKKLLAIISCLNLPNEQERICHHQDKEQMKVSYEIERKKEKLFLYLQSNAQTGESYFLLTSVDATDDQTQRYYSEKLSEIMDLRSCYRYTGQISEKTSSEGRQKLMETALKSLHAKELDQYKDKFLISSTAYSNGHNNGLESLQIAGEKVNMQIAIKSDVSDQNTIIYLGLPLLINDY